MWSKVVSEARRSLAFATGFLVFDYRILRSTNSEDRFFRSFLQFTRNQYFIKNVIRLRNGKQWFTRQKFSSTRIEPNDEKRKKLRTTVTTYTAPLATNTLRAKNRSFHCSKKENFSRWQVKRPIWESSTAPLFCVQSVVKLKITHTFEVQKSQNVEKSSNSKHAESFWCFLVFLVFTVHFWDERWRTKTSEWLASQLTHWSSLTSKTNTKTNASLRVFSNCGARHCRHSCVWESWTTQKIHGTVELSKNRMFSHAHKMFTKSAHVPKHDWPSSVRMFQQITKTCTVRFSPHRFESFSWAHDFELWQWVRWGWKWSFLYFDSQWTALCSVPSQVAHFWTTTKLHLFPLASFVVTHTLNGR